MKGKEVIPQRLTARKEYKEQGERQGRSREGR